MNKKTYFLLGALALVLIVYFVLDRNTGNTLKTNDRDFEFKSTGSIDKVFLSNKFNHQFATLEKKDNTQWTVNDSFKANEFQIDLFFETLRKMKVKRPVSKNELDYVRKDIALNGTKVMIYENKSLSKVFYVGGNTQDEMATYFLMENGNEPFVCHIPGWNGFLNARFFTNLDGWRSKNIFKLKADEIKTIDLEWTDNKEASFKIQNEANEPVLFIGGKLMANNIEVNLNQIKSYLNLWENLSFDGFPIDLNPHKIDSISKTKSILTIQVEDKKGNVTTLRIHRKGIKSDSKIQFDEKGLPLEFDVENFYAFINTKNSEVVQIQDYIFGKVMKKGSDFLLKE
jgi:hypothetical protein